MITLTSDGAELKKKAVNVMRSIGEATGCSLEELGQMRDRLNTLRDNLVKV